MTDLTNLEALITSANGVLSALEALLSDRQAEILLSTDSALYTAPTVDVNGLWTLAQSTPNTDNGEYLGIYTLPDTSLCSQIAEITIVSHSAPAFPNAPARLLPPGADPLTGWVDLASVAALAFQEFVAFALRSAQAFEVTARVAACTGQWCHEIDFALSNGEFTPVQPYNYGVYTSGIGWEGSSIPSGASVYLSRVVPTATFTHMEMDVQFANIGNLGITIDGNATVSALNATRGTYEWDGTISGSQIVLNPSSGTGQGAQCTLTRVSFRGTGTNPFGTVNCI